jgi:hypothetical protein
MEGVGRGNSCVRMTLEGKATCHCSLFPFFWMTPQFVMEASGPPVHLSNTMSIHRQQM